MVDIVLGRDDDWFIGSLLLSWHQTGAHVRIPHQGAPRELHDLFGCRRAEAVRRVQPYRTEKTKTVESTRSSSSEDLTFLCTTALHSLLLLLLCSSLGLAVVLGEEGEVGGSGAMLACSAVLSEGCMGVSASAILVVSVQLLQEHLITHFW